MMKKSIKALSVIACMCASTTASAEEIRIASWNIANLASGPNVELRGHARSEEVYSQIRSIIIALDADIIALQEIGSMAGAKAALGEGYDIRFETRCLENEAKCLDDVGDIFTAIAVKKTMTDRITFKQIDDLAMDHVSECDAKPRKVRGSPVAVVEFGGQNIWIPSIHLKSACKHGSTNNDDLQDDCALNAAQFDLLEAWIESRPSGDAVILAGDFNRLLFKAQSLVARLGNAELFPSEDSRACWDAHSFDFDDLKAQARANNPTAFSDGLSPQIYTPVQFGAIDFFVVTGLTGSTASDADMIEMEGLTDFRDPGATLTKCDGSPKPFGNQVLTFGKADPSDHCPIIITLETR